MKLDYIEDRHVNWRDEDNERIVDNGVYVLKSYPKIYKAIKIECFTKEEADTIKAYTDRKYPDIKFYFSWYVFSR